MKSEVVEKTIEVGANVDQVSENGHSSENVSNEDSQIIKLKDLLGIRSKTKLLEKLTKKNISTEKIAANLEIRGRPRKIADRDGETSALGAREETAGSDNF